jgi:TorA maturation chaperone TorD
MSDDDDLAALAPATRLLGRLLVRELDAATLADLQAPATAAALRELGIPVPDAAELEPLAARYCALFLHPAGGLPPVQSLWLEGQYDGKAAGAVRALAAASGWQLAAGARGAPPDHLGCILMLWAELVPERPELAARLRADHMAWAEGALRDASRTDGFYGALARATTLLVQAISPA